MKAMIFAAGLGTRLAPLTVKQPKALIPFHGRPMLEWVIRRLVAAGFNELVINLHHHAGMIANFLEAKHNFNASIQLSYEEELLDTGGGIRKAAPFLQGEDAFLIHNADIISTIDLKKLFDSHQKSRADVTLAVRARDTSRYLLFDQQKMLCGWESMVDGQKVVTRTPSGSLTPFAFCGVHVVSGEILKHLQNEKKFSIIKEYLRWAPTHTIQYQSTDDSLWADLGTVEKIQNAELTFPPDFFLNLL